MTPTEREQLDAIERDRRRRELALLLLLLFIVDQGRRFLLHGLRDSGTLYLPSLDRLTRIFNHAMADAHVGALRRVGRMAGVPLVPVGIDTTELPEYQGLLRYYLPDAIQAATDLREAFVGIARDAMAEAQAQHLPRQAMAKAVADAFIRYGFTRSEPQTVDPAAKGAPAFGLMRHATEAILKAYAGGLWNGYAAPPVVDKLVALRHRSIIDGRTSKYCDLNSGREGLTLPPSDTYWLLNFCPLHRGCRSTVLPIFTAVEFSDAYPVISPQPGYGRAPATAFGVRIGRAA